MGLATMFSRRFWFILHSTRHVLICSANFFFASVCLCADANSSFAARAERAFNEAQVKARQEPTNTAALVQFSRAAFDWAEFTSKDSQREDVAQRGIDAARRAIELSSTNATAYYWLGMNLGQLARTKTLGALKLVREMEDEFYRARGFDAHIDYAGPDRSLGLLYRDAPGWPTSIGSKKQAREHLENAVRLHPEFPDNQLALLESFEKWADRQSFERQLKITEQTMNAAKEKFSGPMWEQSWADWNKRFAEMKSKSGSVGKSQPSKGVK